MPANKYALIRYRVIDNCISNKYKPFPSLDDLMDKCSEVLGKEVSRSTVEKDMNAMKFDGALGYNAPIEYSRNERGYYYSDDSFTIRDVPLNDEEIDAIKIAANTLVQFRDIGPFKQYSSAIDKILDRVSIGAEQDDADLKEGIQFEQAPEVRGNEFLGLLFGAIRENQVITFDYGGYKKGKIKRRVVEPYLLKEYDSRWYLIGFSKEKKDFIVYGLDRMERPEVTGTTFERDESFDPDVYFEYSIGITANVKSEPEEVIVKVKPLLAKYIDSRPLHDSQKIIQEGGDFLLKLFVYNTYELKEKLLSFGAQAQVMAPEELRNEIAQEIKQANKMYE